MTTQALLFRLALFVFVSILSLGFCVAEGVGGAVGETPASLEKDLFPDKAIAVPATEETLHELKKTVAATALVNAPASLALPSEENVKVDPIVEVEKDLASLGTKQEESARNTEIKSATVEQVVVQTPLKQEEVVTAELEKKIAALIARVEVLEKQKDALKTEKKGIEERADKTSPFVAFAARVHAAIKGWVIEPLHRLLSRYLGK